MSSSDPEHDGGPDAEHPSEPVPDPLDVDSAFAAIIAGWADAPTSGSWPAEEDLAVGRHRRADDTDSPGDPSADPDSGRRKDEATGEGPLLPSLGPTLDPPEADDDDPDGFVPPEPPPIPRGDAVSRFAWAGVIGGPAFLLVDVIAWRSAPEILVLGALAGFVGGFVTLVSRMPKHRDDDGDDGAVV